MNIYQYVTTHAPCIEEDSYLYFYRKDKCPKFDKVETKKGDRWIAIPDVIIDNYDPEYYVTYSDRLDESDHLVRNDMLALLKDLTKIGYICATPIYFKERPTGFPKMNLKSY